MSVKVAAGATRGRNGIGNFLLQCKSIELAYCDWAGSSRGMNDFLLNRLRTFATANPQIDLIVRKRPHRHPILRGHYVNGREKVICVRNLSADEINGKLNILRDSSGKKLVRTTRPVTSINESVRGIWSPFVSESAHTV
ncbi:39S ribosomal protein L51, mitochondrial [Savitreella phatthalungensis]